MKKVRHGGNVRDLAMLSAIGILDIPARLFEAEIHWRNFLEDLQKRGIHGLEPIISDDHSGLGYF